MKAKTLLALFAVASLAGWGCFGNPTNEPTLAEIQEADRAREAAIDNDPTLTPEQRELMKQHMSLSRTLENEARGGQ